jgi:hypothetical protein
VALAEDKHAVGELGSDGQDGVRRSSWLVGSGRDLDHGDAGVREHGVERGAELAGSVTDEESAAGGLVAEIHEEVAGLLGGPGPVGMSGHAQDVQVAMADFEREQDVDPAQRDRAGASGYHLTASALTRRFHHVTRRPGRPPEAPRNRRRGS